MFDPNLVKVMYNHLSTPSIEYRAMRTPFAWNKDSRARQWNEPDAAIFNRTGLLYFAIDKVYHPFNESAHQYFINGAERVLNQYHDEPWWFGEYQTKPTKFHVLQILKHIQES